MRFDCRGQLHPSGANLFSCLTHRRLDCMRCCNLAHNTASAYGRITATVVRIEVSLPKTGAPMELSRRKFLRRAATSAAIGVSAQGVPVSRAQEKRGLKIFMHCDMEGSSGIFTREQAWYWENGVREQVAAEARQLFTADVMSAAAATLAAGVSELIVCDTHHGGGNLIREKLSTDPR